MDGGVVVVGIFEGNEEVSSKRSVAVQRVNVHSSNSGVRSSVAVVVRVIRGCSMALSVNVKSSGGRVDLDQDVSNDVGKVGDLVDNVIVVSSWVNVHDGVDGASVDSGVWLALGVGRINSNSNRSRSASVVVGKRELVSAKLIVIRGVVLSNTNIPVLVDGISEEVAGVISSPDLRIIVDSVSNVISISALVIRRRVLGIIARDVESAYIESDVRASSSVGVNEGNVNRRDVFSNEEGIEVQVVNNIGACNRESSRNSDSRSNSLNVQGSSLRSKLGKSNSQKGNEAKNLDHFFVRSNWQQ